MSTTLTPSELLAGLGTPTFHRLYAGARGAFYKIWPCGAYELIVFASEAEGKLYLRACQTYAKPTLVEQTRKAKPITRAEYEGQVKRLLGMPRGEVVARPSAEDWRIRNWWAKIGC